MVTPTGSLGQVELKKQGWFASRRTVVCGWGGGGRRRARVSRAEGSPMVSTALHPGRFHARCLGCCCDGGTDFTLFNLN